MQRLLNPPPRHLHIAMLTRSVMAVLGGLLFGSPAARAESPSVVATIPPVHSLAAAIMEGVGEPLLLLDGGASPHSYSLRPSEAQAIETADLVIWIGPGLETFMERPLEALSADLRQLRLMEVEGLRRYAIREDGGWMEYSHGHDGHADHDDAHDHDTPDAHIWLDPENGSRMAEAIAARLSSLDPDNAERYATNAAALTERLGALDAALAEQLEEVRNAPYVVFHDSYQYFERRYGLNALGAITVSPENIPGARRLHDLRMRIRGEDAACVFSEPQFTPALVATVTEGTGARAAILDPLGAELEPGPRLYPALLQAMGAALDDCLSRTD